MNTKLLVIFLFLTVPILAQHNNRASRDLQFRFGNPGARSLGFGGAFIGLADDATAPVANPAGMVLTGQRSASFELNYNRQDNSVPFQSGTVLQTNLFEFDFNLEESATPEDIYQIPYLAVVFPKGKLRYAFFLQQQANLKREYTTDPILICDFSSGFHPNCQNDPQPEFYPASTDVLDVKMLNAGLSLAWLWGERFSVGFSAFYSRMDYQADSSIDFPQIIGNARVDRLARGEDNNWGAIAGVLWRATEQLAVGATYKRQPEFDYTAQLISSQPLPLIPPDFVQEAIFKVPDSLGIGFSIRPLDALTINFDANRVYYSQVTDDFIDFTQASIDNDTPILQTMPDVTELHVGLEWIFLQFENPLSLRLGYWLDPYHAATNNIEDNQILEGPIDQPFFRDVFFLRQFEEDVDHYALGLGWTFGRKFQLDVAFEAADTGNNATMSGIYRF